MVEKRMLYFCYDLWVSGYFVEIMLFSLPLKLNIIKITTTRRKLNIYICSEHENLINMLNNIKDASNLEPFKKKKISIAFLMIIQNHDCVTKVI